MEYSWLYNPTGIMKVRCGGQLILLTLAEKCILNNIHVISLNTDGLETKMRRDQYNLYLSLVREVEQQFNVQFEQEEYQKIIYQNVNSYLAVTKSGGLKKKGEFVTNPELGSSVNFLVFPKLLEQYFVHGFRPEEVLKNPEQFGLHIYDFCASFKVSRDYTVLHNGIKQQRLNRFFVARNAPYLYKLKNTKSKPDNMLKGWGVEIYNNHTKKPLKEYNLDMRFYLSQINKLIFELESNKTTLF